MLIDVGSKFKSNVKKVDGILSKSKISLSDESEGFIRGKSMNDRLCLNKLLLSEATVL
jgi:hypothetical protein